MMKRTLLIAGAVILSGTMTIAGNMSFPAAPNKSATHDRMKSVSGAAKGYPLALPATAVTVMNNGDQLALYGYVFSKLNGEARFGFENREMGVVCSGTVTKDGNSASSCKHNGVLATKSSSSIKDANKKKGGATISDVTDPAGAVIGKTMVKWAVTGFPDAKAMLGQMQ